VSATLRQGAVRRRNPSHLYGGIGDPSNPLSALLVMVLKQFPYKLITNNLTCGYY
jgi:hypothetical protein